MSHTESGMQTAASFRQRLLDFDKELTELERQLDRTLRPIVLGMYNAAAHKDEEFMRRGLG